MVSDGVMHSRLEQDLSRGEEPIEVLGELRYCGIIDHQTFVNFVQMSLTDNENLQQLLDCYQVYSRSFHITVELMQNVNRHGARLGTEKIINEQRSSIDSLNILRAFGYRGEGDHTLFQLCCRGDACETGKETR